MISDEEDEDDLATCEMYGHDDRVTYRDSDIVQFECVRCGAEWWEDENDA